MFLILFFSPDLDILTTGLYTADLCCICFLFKSSGLSSCPFSFCLLWYWEHLKQCLFEHLKQKRRRKCFFFLELMLVDQRNFSRQFRLGDFVLTLICTWCLLKISKSDVNKELRVFISFQNVFIIVLHILNELGYKLSILPNNKINLFFKTKKTHIYSGIFYWYHVLLREIHLNIMLWKTLYFIDYHY